MYVSHIRIMAMVHELFEVELTICIKMGLALNNQQKLICQNPPKNPTNQPTNQLTADQFQYWSEKFENVNQ